MDRLSRNQWETKIKKYHITEFKNDISKEYFWKNPKSNSFQLTHCGFLRFVQAKINFSMFKICLPTLTGSIVLGLNRLPSPFYFSVSSALSFEYDFAICDDEYAMMLAFMNNNIEEFAKGII